VVSISFFPVIYLAVISLCFIVYSFLYVIHCFYLQISIRHCGAHPTDRIWIIYSTFLSLQQVIIFIFVLSQGPAGQGAYAAPCGEKFT
jgi:hypothetical protein